MVHLLRWREDEKPKHSQAAYTSTATDGWFRKWEKDCWESSESLKENAFHWT